jgi:HPt (histidine-containing phosphotransfer) domain-containing protein
MLERFAQVQEIDAVVTEDRAAVMRRCHDDVGLLRILLEQFHGTLLNAADEVERLCAAEGYRDAFVMVHSVRGAAANLGMPELTLAASHLEAVLEPHYKRRS